MIITRCIKFNKKLINFSYKETKIGDWDDSTFKSYFQVCMEIMEWNLSFAEAIC